jgi:hypothetical protein
MCCSISTYNFRQTTSSFNSGTANFGTLLQSSTVAQPLTQTGTPALNFSFGNSSAAASQAAQPAVLTLGGSTLTSLFSNNTTQAQPLQLGQTNVQPHSTQSTGLIFGTPTTKSTGLTFTTQTTTGGLTTAGGLTTGLISMSGGQTTGNLTFSTPLTTGLSFGSTTTTTGNLNFCTTQTPGNLSFVTSTTTPLSNSSNWNFGGITTTTSTACKIL